MKQNFKKKVFPNGLTLVFEKRNLPVVSFIYAVRAGGLHEELNEKGISHYIEHMLYKGTPKRNAFQIAKDIEKNGGEMNGFTSEEITGFWCKMPKESADLGLEVLTDLIKNPVFDENELKKERKVIFEEMKMRRDSPQIYVLDKIQSFLYEGSLGEPLIGTEKTMNSLNREKIVKKFKEIYNPSNLILCVVGNYDFNKLVRYLGKNFSGKGKTTTPQKIRLKNRKKIEERDGLDQANLVFAYHSPLSSDKRVYAAKVLSMIMTGGMSSRLFSEIREKRNLAYSVKGDLGASKDYSYSFIYVGTTPEKIEEIKNLILDEFEKVSKELSREELIQVKKQIIGNYQLSMEDTQSQMINLLSSEVSSKAEDFYNFQKEIEKVKLEEVKKLASEVKKGYSFFALVPKKNK